MRVKVHPRIASRHPEISAEDVKAAWTGYAAAATRIPGEREMRVGFDAHGRKIEMVGALMSDGTWLVYHAMTPPSEKTEKELRNAKRARR